MTSVLELKGLTKRFPVRRGVLGRTIGHVEAVSDVDLTVAPGETLALVGESGCGKSTLGRMALRLIDPTAGTVSLAGEDITRLKGAALRQKRRDMQIIFQDPFGSLNPRMTVGEVLAEPLTLHGVARAPAELRAATLDLIVRCGLTADHASRYPHEFSGGQRQRVGIARALATRPKLIVCDEPVSALDVSVQAQILNLLRDLQRDMGIAYVFISHDLGVVRQVADRVAVMYLGRIVEEASAETLFSAPLHPYTRSLLDAVPRPDPVIRRGRIGASGDAPSAMAVPPGCAFHTRCPMAQDKCKKERPPLSVFKETLVACHFAEPMTRNASAQTISPAFAKRLAVLDQARRNAKESVSA
ncbi:MAG: oligopeptide/dipeptide ABC transporter ATP-binding protein [Pseudomonadota bacterium]